MHWGLMENMIKMRHLEFVIIRPDFSAFRKQDMDLILSLNAGELFPLNENHRPSKLKTLDLFEYLRGTTQIIF